MPVYKESALTRYKDLRKEYEGTTFKMFLEKLYDNCMTRSWPIEEIRKRAEVGLELLELEDKRFIGTFIDKDHKGEEGSREQRILMVEGDIDDVNLFRAENEKLKEALDEAKNKIKVLNMQVGKLEKKTK